MLGDGADSDDTSNSPSSSYTDPPSLRAFKEALQRREAAMDEMHSEMLATAALITAPTDTPTVPRALASSGSSSIHLSPPSVADAFRAANSDGVGRVGICVSSVENAAEDLGFVTGPLHSVTEQSAPPMFSITAENLANAIAAATSVMLLAAPKPGSVPDKGWNQAGMAVRHPPENWRSPLPSQHQPPAEADSPRNLPAEDQALPGMDGGALSRAGSDSSTSLVSSSVSNGVQRGVRSTDDGVLVSLDVERRAIRDQYRAQEAALAAEKEQKRITAGLEADARLREAEVRMLRERGLRGMTKGHKATQRWLCMPIFTKSAVMLSLSLTFTQSLQMQMLSNLNRHMSNQKHKLCNVRCRYDASMPHQLTCFQLELNACECMSTSFLHVRDFHPCFVLAINYWACGSAHIYSHVAVAAHLWMPDQPLPSSFHNRQMPSSKQPGLSKRL